MAFAVSCGQAPTARGEAEYSVMTISTSDVTIPSTHSATIRGRQDIAIYPQVSGTISKVCVKEGEVVRQGQLLFIIDQVPYKAALQTAKANVAAAEASVATAQLTYDSKKEAVRQERRFAVRPANFPEQPADGKIPVGTGRGTGSSMRPTTSPIPK